MLFRSYPEALQQIESPEWQHLYVNAEHDGLVGIITPGRESYNTDVDHELNRAIDWLKKAQIDRVIVTHDFHLATQLVGAETSEFYPALERELEILRARVPECAQHLSEEIVAFVHSLRSEDLFKNPGIAETIDWARCLIALDAVTLSPEVISDTLGALLKYQDDIAKITGSEASRILGEARAQAAQVANAAVAQAAG